MRIHHRILIFLSQIIKNRYYKLVLPDDAWIIDLIVEANFKYLSHISLYLPNVRLILQPTCHTEILMYATNSCEIIDAVESIVAIAQKIAPCEIILK